MEQQSNSVDDPAGGTYVVRTLNKRAILFWAAVAATVALVVTVIVINSPKKVDPTQAVVDACTAKAFDAAPSNGMTWDGTPLETPAANETDLEKYKRGSDQAWIVTGKIPAGAAPWTSGITFYSCTVYVDRSGDVDEVRDMRIFG